jgi:WD40 repeat protein
MSRPLPLPFLLVCGCGVPLGSGCHEPDAIPHTGELPPDAAPGAHLPPLSCADAVITEDPRGAGGVPDLCGAGAASCFVPGASFAGDSGLLISADWAPADDLELAGAVDEVRLLRVDPAADTLRLLATDAAQVGRITVAWAPDGAYALGVGDLDTRLYRITREPPAITLLATLVTHRGDAIGVAWAPDGRSAITTGKDSTARLLAVDTTAGTLAEIARFTAPGKRLFTVSYALDGRHALVGGEDGSARLLAVDPAARTLTLVAELDHAAQVCPVAFSPRGDALVGTWVPCHSAVELVQIDAAAGTMTSSAPLLHHESGLRALEWAPDGSYALSGGHDDTIRFLGRHAGSMRVLDVLPQSRLGVHALSFSPDGRYFVHVASQEDRLTLVDARACVACLRRLDPPPP